MVVYILYSDSIEKYYVGITADIADRILRHNSGRSKFTKRGTPWQIVKTISCNSRSQAAKLELKIKKRGAKRWLSENN